MEARPQIPITTHPARDRSAAFFALAITFLVFAVMGISGAMATTLVPAVRAIFGLSLSSAIAVQWIALVVIGFASLPLARLLQWRGAAQATIFGLTLVTLGCLAVAIAVLPNQQLGPQYATLLCSLAVVALGNTTLQVAANLLAVELGDRSKGPARLTLAQGFNSLGVLIGVHIGASYMLGAGCGASNACHREIAIGTAQVYLFSATVSFVVLMFAIFGRRLLAIPIAVAPADPKANVRRSLFRSGWALAGAGAIALYVGAEGAIGSILISFLQQPAVLDLPVSAAGALVANVYWGGALLGRFAGGWLLSGRLAPRILAGTAAFAAIACFVALSCSGQLAGWAALSIGLLNAIMFPVIFSITLERAAAPPAAVSGLLSMSIGGGALISVAVGWVGDRFGISAAFAVPMCAYLYVLVFAVLAVILPGSSPPPQESRTTSSVGKRSDLT